MSLQRSCNLVYGYDDTVDLIKRLLLQIMHYPKKYLSKLQGMEKHSNHSSTYLIKNT